MPGGGSTYRRGGRKKGTSSTSLSSLPAETLKRLLEAPIPLIDRLYNEKLAQEEQARVEREGNQAR
jgi:hypothetical protein